MSKFALVALLGRKSDRPTDRFSKQLLHSNPITPKHQPPTAIMDNGFRSFVHEDDFQFLLDFADFGPVMNWWLADEHVEGAWRLQELPESHLKLDNSSDMPTFGRRYDVFHNQARLGTVEISAGLHYLERPNVRANLDLDSVRLLPFRSVAGFLDGIALHVCNQDRSSKEYLEAQQRISYSLSQVLWDAQRIHHTDLHGDCGELELSLTGTADLYFARRDALRRQKDAQ